MSYISGLAAGRAERKDTEDRAKSEANVLMGSLSPYLDHIDIVETGKKYANVTEENFDKMMYGEGNPDKDLSKLELMGDGTKFVKPKEHDTMVKFINSLSTARSYTDMEGKTVEGEVVGIRINPDNGNIHYDIKGDQGVVPKTLGFSNDPNDVVMTSDTESFRTLFNTAVRKTDFSSNAAALRQRGQTLLATQEKYDTNVLNKPVEEMDAEEQISFYDTQVKLGKMSPVEAAEKIVAIGSMTQDAIDDYNSSQREKTEQAQRDADSQNQTLTKDQAMKMVADGMFFDQSGDIQRQILSLVPSNYLAVKAGVNNEEQQQLRDSTGVQKLERTQTTEKVPGPVPRARVGSKQVTTTRLTEAAPDNMTQNGVEYQRTTPKAEVFAGTDLVFPKTGSAEEISTFLTENKEELMKIGMEETFLNNAQQVFNRYDIKDPSDFRKIPDDPEIEFGRKEAAVAYAIAAGSEASFNENFEFAYNLMNTDDGSTNVYDRLDTKAAQIQREDANRNKTSQIRNTLIQQGRDADLAAFDEMNELAGEIDYFKDYTGETQKSFQNPLEGGEQLRQYKKLINVAFKKGGINGTELRPNLENMTGSTAEIVTQEIGDLVAAYMVSEGVKEPNGVFGTRFLNNRENYSEVAGNIAGNIEIQTRVVGNKEQIAQLVIRDPNGKQMIPIMTGNQFRQLFPDKRSADLALAAFKLEQRTRE